MPDVPIPFLTTDELVKLIARKYDSREIYRAEWQELVKRVGEEAAERMVDQAN